MNDEQKELQEIIYNTCYKYAKRVRPRMKHNTISALEYKNLIINQAVAAILQSYCKKDSVELNKGAFILTCVENGVKASEASRVFRAISTHIKEVIR